MLSDETLIEIERIVSLPREEFLESLTAENRRNYLAAEKASRRYFSRVKKANDEAERGIDYNIMID